MDKDEFMARYDLKHRMTEKEYKSYKADLDKVIEHETFKKLMSLGKVIGGGK